MVYSLFGAAQLLILDTINSYNALTHAGCGRIFQPTTRPNKKQTKLSNILSPYYQDAEEVKPTCFAYLPILQAQYPGLVLSFLR